MNNLTVNFALPTTRTDGSALPVASIQTVKIYQSFNGSAFTLSNSQPPSPPAASNSLTINNVAPGAYSFKVSYVDTNNQESALSTASTPVSVAAVPAPPSAGAAPTVVVS